MPQMAGRVEVVVVDQSSPPDAALALRAATDPGLRVVVDEGVGLSRSRNVGCRETSGAWIAFLDDDCRPAEDWGDALSAALERCGDAEVVSGAIEGAAPDEVEYLEVTTFLVDSEGFVSGRWTLPWRAGFGSCTVRRSAVDRLGGWDERLGVGCLTPFGAAEDMDFNYRLLRSGGRAFVTPAVRVTHEQWRPADDLPGLYRRYMTGWSGFAMKHLRRGDVAGGLWLWALGALDAVRMLASAGRRRSRLRLVVGLAKARGLLVGTVRGLLFPWGRTGP